MAISYEMGDPTTIDNAVEPDDAPTAVVEQTVKLPYDNTFPADDRSYLRAIRNALELDGSKVTLQSMRGITSSHTNPNNFEKMRVGLAVKK
ncbi:hypothetical protein MTO96_025445 [Rhipicephalus appendiculatus]